MYAELKYRFLWQLVGYALVILVTYLSVTSRPIDIGPEFDFKDKIYHLFAYFTLMVWFAQLYHSASMRYIFATVFILMGVLMEFIQSFDPARYYEYGDMVANSAGVLTGFLLTMNAGKFFLVRVEGLVFKKIQ